MNISDVLWHEGGVLCKTRDRKTWVFNEKTISVSTDEPTSRPLHLVRSLFTAIAMEFRQHKVNLSFSIENILREDFPHRQRTHVANLPTVRESCLERWGTMPFYQCYTVRYSPIFVKRLPDMYKGEGRLHRVNREKEQILPEQEKKIDDHCLSCKDEALHHSSGKHLITILI